VNINSVSSYSELSKIIEDWISFNNTDVGHYDFVGMMLLFKSVVNNLKKYSIENDFETLDEFLDESEIYFLREMILKLE